MILVPISLVLASPRGHPTEQHTAIMEYEDQAAGKGCHRKRCSKGARSSLKLFPHARNRVTRPPSTNTTIPAFYASARYRYFRPAASYYRQSTEALSAL